MDILWWLKWIVIVLFVWTTIGIVVALFLGAIIKRINNGDWFHHDNGQ